MIKKKLYLYINEEIETAMRNDELKINPEGVLFFYSISYIFHKYLYI